MKNMIISDLEFKLIENNIYKIADDIIANQEINTEPVNLYKGTTGSVLFFSLLYEYSQKEKYKKYTYELVNITLNNLLSLEGKGSLSGYSGIIWMLSYLVKRKWFDYVEISPYLCALKQLTTKSLKHNLNAGHFDLMHGFIGELIGIINLYECEPESNKDLLETIANGINKLITTGKNLGSSKQIYWQNKYRGVGIINIGLAHGVSSVISFLTHLTKKSYLSKKLKSQIYFVLERSCYFLLDNRILHKKDGPRIPSDILLYKENKNPHLKFAWCHGDLGASVALLKAGSALNNEPIISETNKILLSLANYRQHSELIMQNNLFVDSSFCHGITGAFFMFYTISRIIDNSKFKQTYQYWENLMLSVSSPNQKFLNLKYGEMQDTGIIAWKESSGLLNGVSGYGITLLTYLINENNVGLKTDWTELFF